MRILNIVLLGNLIFYIPWTLILDDYHSNELNSIIYCFCNIIVSNCSECLVQTSRGDNDNCAHYTLCHSVTHITPILDWETCSSSKFNDCEIEFTTRSLIWVFFACFWYSKFKYRYYCCSICLTFLCNLHLNKIMEKRRIMLLFLLPLRNSTWET